MVRRGKRCKTTAGDASNWLWDRDWHNICSWKILWDVDKIIWPKGETCQKSLILFYSFSSCHFNRNKRIDHTRHACTAHVSTVLTTSSARDSRDLFCYHNSLHHFLPCALFAGACTHALWTWIPDCHPEWAGHLQILDVLDLLRDAC